jgi:hypothetical protein
LIPKYRKAAHSHSILISIVPRNSRGVGASSG